MFRRPGQAVCWCYEATQLWAASHTWCKEGPPSRWWYWYERVLAVVLKGNAWLVSMARNKPLIEI